MHRVWLPGVALTLAIGAAFVAAAPPAGAQTNQTATPAPAPAHDTVVAVVNGAEIRLSELMQILQTLPEQYRQVPLPMLYPQLLDQAVSRKLLAQAARAQKLQNDKAVKAQVAALEEQVLQQVYLTRRIEAEITEEKLRAQYDATIANGPGDTQVRARHILLKTEDEAKAVITELGNGADFEALARTRSTGPSASEGGDLGYFGEGQMVQAFSEAAFAMKKGETSATPVQTEFGWHVIKVEDRREQAPASFSDSIPELRQAMVQETVRGVVAELTAGAEIKRFGMDGKPLTAAPKSE